MTYGWIAVVDPAKLPRDHGLQVTVRRLAVLRAVAARPHRTADGVAEAVRTRGPVLRTHLGGSPALHEGRVGDNHHPLIRRTCGKTVEVECAAGEAPCLTAADASGFEIHEAEVIY